MPQITIQLSQAAYDDLVKALGSHFAYRDRIREGQVIVDNPESEEQFAKRMLLFWLKERVKTYRRQQAMPVAGEPDIT